MDEYIVHINKREKTESLRKIEEAIVTMQNGDVKHAKEYADAVIGAVREAINNGDRFIVPVEMSQSDLDDVLKEGIQVGDSVEVFGDLDLEYKTLEVSDGKEVYAAFTSQEEVTKGEATSTITVDIEHFLEKVLMNEEVEGLTLNPWNLSCFLPKSFIKRIFESNLPEKGENNVNISTGDFTQEASCIVNFSYEMLDGDDGEDDEDDEDGFDNLDDEDFDVLDDEDFDDLDDGLGGGRVGKAHILKDYSTKPIYIIHMVVPLYSGTEDDARMIRRCVWGCLELARERKLYSIVLPAISSCAQGYNLENAAEIEVSAIADWFEVNPGYGMQVMLSCDNDKIADMYKTIRDVRHNNREDRPVVWENDGMLEKAVQYAMECHKGAVRKGTVRPYILHPIETMQILSSMNADIELLAAGVLHDTLEDTEATLFDIYERFGVGVAALVNFHTEDKSKIWYMRKLRTITDLHDADIRRKMLVMADMVANLRNMYADYKKLGDDLWDRFNAPKKMQAWYYSKANDEVYEMQNYPETEDVYWEMVALFSDLFVKYAVDEEKGIMYRICDDGEFSYLKKGDPQWNDLESGVLENVRVISRRYAERIEDNWAEPFWELHEKDMADGYYELFSASGKSISISISEGELRFVGLDFDKNCEAISGKEEYVFRCRLDVDDTDRLLVQLRRKHGTQNKLLDILKNEFGGDDGTAKFKAFCEEAGIEYQLEEE